jgi:uncharacterized membrane protein
MDLLDVSLIFSIMLCSLVGGFTFTYAIVVMPGLSSLNDREFIRAFQVADAVIQNNQPLFMLTWIGSIVSLLSTVFISAVNFGLPQTWLIVLTSAVYLLGVQGTTIAVHIPLNNNLQKIIIEKLSDKAITEERMRFEGKWNHFNNIRTIISISVCLLLLIILSLR